MAMLPCNWLQCMENSLDPVHVEFLHGRFMDYVWTRRGRPIAVRQGAPHKKIGFDRFEHGIVKRRVVEGTAEEDRAWRVGHPVIFPHVLKNAGTGGYNFQIRVPVDDTHTLHIYYSVYRPGIPVPPQDSMARTRAALERLAGRVAKGQLKAPEKIGAAASRTLGRHHGHRYYDWRLEGGAFRFFEHPVHLRREEAYKGTYLIETEEADLSPMEAVQAYKQLAEVEQAFRCLKDVLELRPIYHRRPERVEAHIFVAALAFLLQCTLEKKLKAAGVPLSAAQALEALRTVHVVDVQVGETSTRGVTLGSGRGRQVLAALGLTDRSPPGAPATTRMPT